MPDTDNLPKLAQAVKMTKPNMAKLVQLLFKRVLERAFPSNTRTPAIGSDGQKVWALSRDYRWYKSGTRLYESTATKAKAIAQRRMNDAGVKYRVSDKDRNWLVTEGKGLGVSSKGKAGLKTIGISLGGGNVMGPRADGRRLGQRPGVENNQLTGATRQAFHARAISEYEGELFFTDRQEVAAALEWRDPWIEPTQKEQAEVLETLSRMIGVEIDKLPKVLYEGTVTIKA